MAYYLDRCKNCKHRRFEHTIENNSCRVYTHNSLKPGYCKCPRYEKAKDEWGDLLRDLSTRS